MSVIGQYELQTLYTSYHFAISLSSRQDGENHTTPPRSYSARNQSALLCKTHQKSRSDEVKYLPAYFRSPQALFLLLISHIRQLNNQLPRLRRGPQLVRLCNARRRLFLGCIVPASLCLPALTFHVLKKSEQPSVRGYLSTRSRVYRRILLRNILCGCVFPAPETERFAALQ